MTYGEDIKKVLLTNEQIKAKTQEIADQINKDYQGEQLMVVCILRGAVIFMADLFSRLTIDAQMDFMAVSSYGAGTQTTGEVKINKDMTTPIDGKNLLIVEDIIDTGTTLSNLVKLLKTRNPKSIKICSLLDKPERRTVDFDGDYVGFKVPNEFVVGYGLDYDEKYRNLPDVCVLAPHVYSEN